MTIKLGTNIESLRAQRQLGNATALTSNLYEQLSSGMRIVRPSDDAASLAIAEDLNAKSRVYSRAILNANDGHSVLGLADATLSNLSEIVTRIRELSEQSANGTYSTNQRKAIDTEAQALAKEYFRISRATSFNKTNLFDGTLSEGLRLQVGYGTDGSLHSRIGGSLGTGTVAGGTSYADQNTGSSNVVLGDLNGDGNLDMVTGSALSSEVTIRMGDGSGGFGSGAILTNGSASLSVVTLGDLNGDGILDLVSAGTDGTGYVNARLGNGNGTFRAAISYEADSASTSVVLGDLNGDGILDIVTSGSTGGVASLSVRLGAGNGTFGALASFSGHNPLFAEVTVGDVNGDGILDLAAVETGRTAEIAIFLGNGNGTFSAESNFSSGLNSGNSLVFGDLNSDGILDLVATGDAGAGRTGVLLGNGNGTFRVQTTYSSEGTSSKKVTLADMNGDGNLDLVTAGLIGAGGYTTIRLGSGQGTFGTATSFASDTAASYGVATGDINGDGVPDLITAGQTSGGEGSTTTFFGNTRDGVSPLLPFSLKTKADSLQSMGMLDRTLSNLSRQRGVIGAFQSRLSVATNVLQSGRDNFRSAESSIRDVDVAAATSGLARAQIIQKAATAILAQANSLPDLALQLLR